MTDIIHGDPIEERNRELAAKHGLRMPTPSESVIGGKRMTDRTMPPVGPEMDARVAKAVGADPYPSGGESRVTGNAMWALDRWREQHPEWSIQIDFNQPCHPGVWEVCLYNVSGKGEFTPYEGIALTVAEAICEAIIRVQWALEDAR